MTLPDWLALYRGLTDDALAALGNKGLVRRALKMEAELVESSATGLSVQVGGSLVRLTPQGPQTAVCPCPAAGVCVHVIAACVWARQISDDSPATSSKSPEPAGPAGPAEPTEVDEQTEPAEEPKQDEQPQPTSNPEPDAVLREVLGWDPAVVNRGAGTAAVRRLAAVAAAELSVIEVSENGGTLTLTWPGSPQIIVLAGGGFKAMIVGGKRSEAERKRLQLEAVVRLWGANGQPWPWPEAVVSTDQLQAGELEAARYAVGVIENLVGGGLGHLPANAAERLTGASQRAKIEDLPLLSSLLSGAEGAVRKLAGRDDATGEADVLGPLAQAWALARAITRVTGGLPANLRGTRDGTPADLGVLLPLGVHWWVADSGARGFTMHWWDAEHGRIETLTAGRASGADPGFQKSWDAPLAWGRSLSALCSMPIALSGAERKSDGTLSATGRTKVTPAGEDAGVVAGAAASLGLDPGTMRELADAVNARDSSEDVVGFGASPEHLRIIVPRGSLRNVSLDEVNQVIYWEVTDSSGREHELRLPARGVQTHLVNWLLANLEPIHGIVVGSDNEPIALFTGKPVRLVSTTLTPVPWVKEKYRVRKRRAKLNNLAVSQKSSSGRNLGPLERWMSDVREVVLSPTVTGRAELTPRHQAEVERHIRTATDMGLGSFANALRDFLSAGGSADSSLRVWFLLDRLETIAASAQNES